MNDVIQRNTDDQIKQRRNELRYIQNIDPDIGEDIAQDNSCKSIGQVGLHQLSKPALTSSASEHVFVVPVK